MTRDGVELHLGHLPDDDPRAIRGTAYLWVDDADEVAEEWRQTGADVRTPEGTDWGQHEGVLIDPDGNISGSVRPLGASGPVPSDARYAREASTQGLRIRSHDEESVWCAYRWVGGPSLGA